MDMDMINICVLFLCLSCILSLTAILHVIKDGQRTLSWLVRQVAGKQDEEAAGRETNGKQAATLKRNHKQTEEVKRYKQKG